METLILTHARWDVRWVVNKRVVIVDCGDDFAEALRIYTKAVAGERVAATLRCKNAGFAPPQRLRPYLEHKRKGDEGIPRTPLEHYNRRGWFWCPYCSQLRKFILRSGFHVEGIWVPEAGYHCPICEASHRDGSVRKWNPLAVRYYEEGVRQPRRSRA